MGDFINKEIIQKIKDSQTIAILTHVRADGDAIGSALAMAHSIKKSYPDKKVIVLTEEKIPKKYTFLDTEVAKVYEGKVPKDLDLCLTVDTASRSMLGRRNEVFDAAKSTAKIDHHYTSENYADLNHRVLRGSCGEIIYGYCKELTKDTLDKNIATDLYMAISSDTKGFKFDSDKLTHEIAGELVSFGIDGEKIQTLLNAQTLSSLRLVGLVAEHIETNKSGDVVYSQATAEDFRKAGATKEDEEGLIDKTTASIVDAKIAILVTQREDGSINGELRRVCDNKNIDVSKIATIFGGGGHQGASGFQLPHGDLDQIKKMVMEEAQKTIDIATSKIMNRSVNNSKFKSLEM